MNTATKQTKEQALAEHLDIELDDAKELIENGDYLVYTSVWAFNASFLSSFCDLPEEVFKALQPGCESSNDAILSLIERSGGLDSFVKEAVSADGRGHLISSYDGEEIEVGQYYIYKIN